MSARPRATRLLFAAILAVVAAATALTALEGQPQQGQGQATQAFTSPPGAVRFEYIGPQSAGRIAAAAGVVGKPGVYFAGAASGGVWKSSDGGQTWKPTFDNQKIGRAHV